MTLYLVNAGQASGDLQAGTEHFAICGRLFTNDFATTEAFKQFRARNAWTFSDLYVHIIDNNSTAASTARFRKNGANGNQSVSIPASTNGVFQDTTNTDSVASGDLINNQTVVGNTNLKATNMGYAVEDTGGNVFPVATSADLLIPPNDTRQFPINGFTILEATKANVQYRTRTSTTYFNLRCFLEANGISDPSTVKFQVNGANVNQTITIPASTSGEFEDTTNTDTVAVNNLISHEVVAGMGAHNDTALDLQIVHMHGDSAARPSVGGRRNNVASVEFIALEFPDGTTTGEAQAQISVRSALDFSNAFVIVSFAGTGAWTIALRKNGVNSSVIINIPASVTGEFEDTTNIESFVASDLVNSRAVPAGEPDFGVLAYLTEETPVVAEGPEIIRSRHADQLHPRAAPRAAPLSYWQDNLLAVEELEFPPIRPMFQLHPRAAPRAEPYSYWIDNLLVVEERVFPPIRPMVQLHPRAAPRAAPLSYWIDNLLAVEEFPPIQPMLQLHPRAAPRAGPLAYWIDNLLAVPELVPPPIRPMDQLHPRAAPRSAPLAYWIDNLLVVEERLFPPIRPMEQLHPRAAPRAAPLAYWIDNLLVVPEIAAVTIELTYVIDAIIGSPAVGFQQKQLIVKRMFVKLLQLKDLIGPE